MTLSIPTLSTSSLSSNSPQGVGLAPPLGTRLTPVLKEVFANVDDLPLELTDMTVFWHGKCFVYGCMRVCVCVCVGYNIITKLVY